MRASFFVPVFALAAFAQDESSSAAPTVPSFTGDAFPQTSFLQQTNSLGVVTGQPAVETSIPSQPENPNSQPAVATSVGEAASIPAVGTGIHTIVLGNPDNSTRTLVVSANNSTTVVLGNPTSKGASGSGASATTTGGDSTGTGASGATGASGTGNPESTGAAANVRALAGSLVGAGAFVAAFL